MILPAYDPNNWFWIVQGDETKAYSSALGDFTSSYDVGRLTRIASIDELIEVLRAENVPPYHRV